MNEPGTGSSPIRMAVDISLNLLILALLFAWCLYILMPFVSLVTWGGVIAIAIYPSFLKLATMLGGRRKLAAAIIALLGFAIVIVPLWSFTASLIESAARLTRTVASGALVVPPPPDDVMAWPLVGDRVHAAWTEVATNLSGFFEAHEAQVRTIVAGTLGRVAGAGLGALQFLASIAVAAAFLLGAGPATAAARMLAHRLVGDRGEELRALSVATIRSVAVGVLGIAAIQALLAGIGIAFAGVPAAGLWALIVLILAVAQLPPLLVLGPMAVYVFSVQSTTVSIVFLIWSIGVSFSDAVLKPMLLGRGVDAPMLVILLGAIGGMLTSGIIGLFVGAVVLALGYKLLQLWLSGGTLRPPDGGTGTGTGTGTGAATA